MKYKSIDQYLEINTIPEPNNGCHLWIGRCDKKGYGVIKQGSKDYRAHRYLWEMVKGKIPAGLSVLHKCDVRCCVNTNHLFLGTQKDNMADCSKKKRFANAKKTHCKNGHAYSIENTVIKKRYDKLFRSCKTCIRTLEHKRRLSKNGLRNDEAEFFKLN